MLMECGLKRGLTARPRLQRTDPSISGHYIGHTCCEYVKFLRWRHFILPFWDPFNMDFDIIGVTCVADHLKGLEHVETREAMEKYGHHKCHMCCEYVNYVENIICCELPFLADFYAASKWPYDTFVRVANKK